MKWQVISMNEINHFRPPSENTDWQPTHSETNVYPTVKRNGNYSLDTNPAGAEKRESNFSLRDFLFVSCLALFFVILVLTFTLSLITIRKNIQISRARQEANPGAFVAMATPQKGPEVVLVDRIGQPLGCVLYENIKKAERASIKSVIQGGPAADAGLKAKDIILALDDQEINSLWDIRTYLQTKSTGDRVEVVYLRGGETGHTSLILDGD